MDKEGALHVKMSVEKNTKANEKQVHNFCFAELGKCSQAHQLKINLYPNKQSSAAQRILVEGAT